MIPIAESLAKAYALNHRNALEAVAELDDDQLRWRPPRSNSVAFNLWHMARWADHLQSILSTITPAMRQRIGAQPEIWARENVAASWGFPVASLGTAETGMGMDEDASARLVLPTKAELLSYVEGAFEAADSAVRAVRDEDLNQAAELEPARYLGQVAAGYGTVAADRDQHPPRVAASRDDRGSEGRRGCVTVTV